MSRRVRQSNAIEFAEDEVAQIVGLQAFDYDGGGEPACAWSALPESR
jgi:hypothetical protein